MVPDMFKLLNKTQKYEQPFLWTKRMIISIVNINYSYEYINSLYKLSPAVYF